MDFTSFSFDATQGSWTAIETGLDGLDVGLGYVGATEWQRTHTLSTPEMVARFPSRKREIAQVVAAAHARLARRVAEYDAAPLADADADDDYW